MNPDFDRAERHARSLDGEDDSVREAAEADPPEDAPKSGADKVREVVAKHPVAGTVGALTGAATGTVVAGPAGTVIGAATGAARGVVVGEALEQVGRKLHLDEEREPAAGA